MIYNYKLFLYLLLPLWVNSQCNQTLEDDNSIYVGCLNFEGIPHGKGKLLITFDDQTQTQDGNFEDGEFLSGELIVFCGALIGSGIGFLWYNTYPAQVFMGDIGSLALGAILGIIAIILRHELVFAIMAGVFVMETLSVAIQVISYKTRGKRVFLMAPIHHHYELKGWAEPKIIVRFWIITLVLILVALATLKLR